MAADRRPPSPSPRAPADRGAVLVVALVIMSVLAMGLSSYLTLNLNTARQAQRAFQQAAAFNLAEAGAEEALWCFNRAAAGATDAWNGWTTSGTAAWRPFTDFALGSATGRVQVHVDQTSLSAGTRPTVVVKATVSSPGVPDVTRYISASLRRRSRFTNGLLARDAITFSGTNTSVDSWDSDPDNNAATAPVAYGTSVRNDGGIVASLSVQSRAVLVNQADIWGYVHTGGAAPEVGVNGSVTGRSTPSGVNVDPARVSTDFSASLPDVTTPTDGTPVASLGATLGTAGTTTRWRTSSLSLNGRQTFTVDGNVTLILTAGSGARALDVTGNASVIISSGASLTIYTEGNIQIAGNGLANSNPQPISCLIYGTNTSSGGQSIHIAGNGALRAAVYAPNAEVRINGNADVMGAVVGRTIDLTGNAAFHYDEALGDFVADMPFGPENWRELLTPAERSPHESKFTGW